MHGRSEGGLEGRGREVHAGIEHRVEERGVRGAVAAAWRRRSREPATGEERREHRPDPLHRHRDAGRARPRHDRVGGRGGPPLRLLPDTGTAEHIERREAGGHRERIARERARLVDRPRRRDLLHEAPPAAVRRRRESAADHLAEDGDVGLDTVEHLRADAMHAPAGHHLVEDEERAARAGLSGRIARDHSTPRRPAGVRRGDDRLAGAPRRRPGALWHRARHHHSRQGGRGRTSRPRPTADGGA